MSTGNKYQPRRNTSAVKELVVPRQRLYSSEFRKQYSNVKADHASGVYSFAEGLTRRACRRIANRRARMLNRFRRNGAA